MAFCLRLMQNSKRLKYSGASRPYKIKWILLWEKHRKVKRESDHSWNRTRLNKRAFTLVQLVVAFNPFFPLWLPPLPRCRRCLREISNISFEWFQTPAMPQVSRAASRSRLQQSWLMLALKRNGEVKAWRFQKLLGRQDFTSHPPFLTSTFFLPLPALSFQPCDCKWMKASCAQHKISRARVKSANVKAAVIILCYCGCHRG